MEAVPTNLPGGVDSLVEYYLSDADGVLVYVNEIKRIGISSSRANQFIDEVTPDVTKVGITKNDEKRMVAGVDPGSEALRLYW